jgi:hypothetical protein
MIKHEPGNVLVIQRGPIGNAIWEREGIVEPLVKAGYGVDVARKGFATGLYPQNESVRLLHTTDEELSQINFDAYDKVVISERDAGLLKDVFLSLDPEKLVLLADPEAWRHEYPSHKDLPIVRQTGENTVLRSMWSQMKEAVPGFDHNRCTWSPDRLIQEMSQQDVSNGIEKIVGAFNDIDPNLLTQMPLVTLNVATSTPLKDYPHWISVAQKLAEDGFAVMLIGGPQDPKPAPSDIATRTKGCIVDMIGKLNLRETALSLYVSSMHIAADTGTTHIAATMGIPTVVVFGEASIPEAVAAYNDRACYIQSPGEPGLINPNQVAEAAARHALPNFKWQYRDALIQNK